MQKTRFQFTLPNMDAVKHAIKHHWTHYLGLSSSALCLVHCLALPFIVPFLPALMAVNNHSWKIEGAFIALIALATITIINGYRLHKSQTTLIFAAFGFVFLVTSLFLETHWMQIASSCVGSAFMLTAQYTNYRLCRVQTCCAHPHH